MTSAAGVQTTAAASQAHELSTHAMALQTIAHELRQPLSTIESIAYYLKLVLPRDDRRCHEQMSRLQGLVEQSNWILSCGLQLVNETPLAPEPVDLEELITQVAAVYSSRRDLRLDLEFASGLPLARVDPGRGRVLIENLLMLFQYLAHDTHNDTHTIHLATSPAGTGVRMALTARVPGYRHESAFGPGCCLSLACARRIVEGHGGTFALAVDPVTGIVLNVVLP